MRRKKFYRNGKSVDQIRTEPADLANTILKMACKRAMIAMTLNVTAASDIFTQDIEDIPEELRTEEAGQPATDPELTAKWVKMASGATNAKALTEIWQAGVKELQAVKDMTAYNAFKAAVGARGEALKKEQAAPGSEPEAQPAATNDDDDVPFD